MSAVRSSKNLMYIFPPPFIFRFLHFGVISLTITGLIGHSLTSIHWWIAVIVLAVSSVVYKEYG